MENKYEKEINGYITFSIRIPCNFKVTAKEVEYENEIGLPYYEMEWEYGPEEIINQVDVAKEINDNYSRYIEEVVVEEY